MNSSRILLVETLEAAGAAAHDTRTRARALRAAGFEPRCAIVASLDDDLLHPVPAIADLMRVRMDGAARATLEAWATDAGADAALVASALPGGGEVGAWIAERFGARAWWWPSGLAAPPAGGALPVLPWDAGTPPAGEPWPGACAGLAASLVGDARIARGQLPLWDGDYLLVPAPFAGAAGEAAIDAFATLCESHDGLDLVVLADPQPAFERIARARGVGFRVHFAGRAPRDAELAWLGAAVAALVAGDAPLSGGLVLRALARGCRLLAAPGATGAAALEAWLASHGLATGALREPLAERLDRALARDPVWAARAHGTLAAHALEPASGRLARALAAAHARRAA